MQKFLDKKQIHRNNKIIKNSILIVVFLIIIFFNFFKFSSPFLNFIGKPIWVFRNNLSDKISNVIYFFESKKSLKIENENLINENLSIKLKMIDYDILKKENDDLKILLNNNTNYKNFILSNILVKPSYSPYDTVIVDVGSDKNVFVGDLVYANNNIPVGKISNVYTKTSLISLYSNPGEKTEGFLNNVNASVILTGRGGGNFEMIIPIDLPISKGDAIVLPGDSSSIIALVEDIISKSTDSFKKVILSSPVNIQNLKWLGIKKD